MCFGEITQLRGVDVGEREGVKVITITPEAGTVKTGRGRVVPLHEHLIAQGFLAFVASRRNGPLFYNVSKGEPRVSVATSPTKPRYVQARERLAMWVRARGVTDKDPQITLGDICSYKSQRERRYLRYVRLHHGPRASDRCTRLRSTYGQ